MAIRHVGGSDRSCLGPQGQHPAQRGRGEGGRGRVTLQKTTAQFADLEDLEFLTVLLVSPFTVDGLVH